MKVGVIGGGLMGLALAFRLTRLGHTVTVFERDKQLGGLTTYHNYGAFVWDRFYHVILPSDIKLISFLQDIGLADQLRWQRTLTGFYVDEQFYSMSNTLEFLRFPPVGFIEKTRLALTILYGAQIKNWRKLEQIPVADWLIRLSGKSTYEKIWKPLLLAKLGENYRRVSAVFIWSYIARMFSARDGSAGKEQLGHVVGGYKTVFDRLAYLLQESGNDIYLDTAVDHIRPNSSGGINITYGNKAEHFDRVVFTSPVNALQQTASKNLLRVDNRGDRVEYLGVICAVLLTRKPLLPYYVLNIADSRIPFTGIIGMSNLVSTDETAGLHITFLPKYIDTSSPLLRESDDNLRERFINGLQIMFPDLADKGIESIHINRAARVQPLQVLNYSQLVPKVASRNPDFFVLNTAQFTHTTLNNNEVIGAVDAFIAQYHPRFEQEENFALMQHEQTDDQLRLGGI